MALLQRSQVTCKEFSIRHANTGGDQEYRLSQIVDNPKILSVSLLEVWHYLLLLFYCCCWNFFCLLSDAYIYYIYICICIYIYIFFTMRKSSALIEGTTMPNWPNASWEGDSATSWMATEGGPDIRHAVDWREKNAHKPQVFVVREKKNSSNCFSTTVITWLLIYLR